MMKTKLILLFVIFLYTESYKAQTITKVLFEYDEAGNQIFRGPDSSGKITKQKETNEIKFKLIADKIKVASVPVITDLNIFWEKELSGYILSIDLLPYNAFKILEHIEVKNNSTNSCQFYMGNRPYGVYYLKFNLSDGAVYTVKVTKN